MFRYTFVKYSIFCLNILSQKKRKSGFGASDELSSEEEEGVQPVEKICPLTHQERHPATTLPASALVSSVRYRNVKSNPKPTLRPQVNLLFHYMFMKLEVRVQVSCLIYNKSLFVVEKINLLQRLIKLELDV